MDIFKKKRASLLIKVSKKREYGSIMDTMQNADRQMGQKVVKS